MPSVVASRSGVGPLLEFGTIANFVISDDSREIFSHQSLWVKEFNRMG